MPRVTEEHRRARRDEIADAAIRVLRRKGVTGTSIADIVEESGLSAGAIYANFVNKSELARYVAHSQLAWRMDLLADAADTVRSPMEILRIVFTTLDEQAPPLEVVLQYWGEATRDADMHRLVTEKVSELRAAFALAVEPWVASHGADPAAASADRIATTMCVLLQGYLANAALFGWTTPEEYLATAAELFEAR